MNATGDKKINYQYQYADVDLDIVIDDPNEYIIPECLPACKVLWDKNIETYMVSNREDDNLYVLVWNLSDENKTLFEDLMKKDSRFKFSTYRNTYAIEVDGITEKASLELKSLANLLLFQDTLRFVSGEAFLENFKTTDGEYSVDENYNIIRLKNPKLENVTLSEALKETGKEELYVKEEDRVYENIMYLRWHQKYLKAVQDGLVYNGGLCNNKKKKHS